MSITINDMIRDIDETKQKIAVGHALIGFLRTRYVSRDGLPPQSQIAYDRSTVTEDVVYEVIGMLESKVEKAETQLQTILKEKVDDR